MIIEAQNRTTRKRLATLKVLQQGVVTITNTGAANGFHGPFHNIAFHVGHSLLRKRFAHTGDMPSLHEAMENGSITEADIAANIPNSYQGILFIKAG